MHKYNNIEGKCKVNKNKLAVESTSLFSVHQPCCFGAFCINNMLNDNITEETSMLCILVTEMSWLCERVLAGLLDVSQAIWDAHWALTACFGRQNCCSQHQTIYCTHKLKNKHVLAHLIGEDSIKITLKCKMEVHSSMQCTSTAAQWCEASSVCADTTPSTRGIMDKLTCFISPSHRCVPSWSSEGRQEFVKIMCELIWADVLPKINALDSLVLGQTSFRCLRAKLDTTMFGWC